MSSGQLFMLRDPHTASPHLVLHFQNWRKEEKEQAAKQAGEHFSSGKCAWSDHNSQEPAKPQRQSSHFFFHICGLDSKIKTKRSHLASHFTPKTRALELSIRSSCLYIKTLRSWKDCTVGKAPELHAVAPTLIQGTIHVFP